MNMKGFEPLYAPHCSAGVELLFSKATSADFSGEVRPLESQRGNNKKKKKNYTVQKGRGGMRGVKKHIYTRRRGSCSGIKKHTSTISWFCGEEEEEEEEEGADTVVKRACQLQ